MLDYTLDQLWNQRAVVERNISSGDAYGAPNPADWQYHSTVRCRLWWSHSTGIRSANRTYVSQNRSVPVSQGGMIVPLGTNITEQDRITQVIDANGNVLYDAVFTVTSVINNETHI